MTLSAYLRNGDSYTTSPESDSTSTNDSRPTSPVSAENVEYAVDDTTLRDQPSQHVDYLSHDWAEEDIWSSRKHLQKQNACSNTARLENTLWRTWTKLRHRLKTVPAENLNWLKDCDVTWLYGPFQKSPDKSSMTPASLAGIGISKLNSSVNQKSILKKRSVLETMLQQSLSASSFPHNTTAAVQTQQINSTPLQQTSDTADLNGVASGHGTSLFSLRPVRQEDSCEVLSINSSGEQSLATSTRKHIHFNDKVEWWIVDDVGDCCDDEVGIESYVIDSDDDDSSSDDEFLMMKRGV